MPTPASDAAAARSELDPTRGAESERAREAGTPRESPAAPTGAHRGAWWLPVAVVALTLLAAALALTLAYRELADESREASLSAEPTQPPPSAPAPTPAPIPKPRDSGR